ncbi:hypothetical protein JAAARDRAFT_188871 [Jaapia argillacea MUCL 33604]|uniref:Conserved oligomeric Golgi complex subunit 1 n=1 Tax=Jaapia argillacea MUCL 33604 TaxID=933084 RepID=A0A067Q8G4_9AGAM|nr:hypothetical protein JAAARDRAFT_188871 [Jaapia argillacea MUCL 33604]
MEWPLRLCRTANADVLFIPCHVQLQDLVMARRPSATSIGSLASPAASLKALPNLSQPVTLSVDPRTNGQGYPSPRSAAHSSRSLLGTLENNVDDVDPDELFTRHTVAEVKWYQQRLRADAEAKQEELRLMVGERYRDLLQASTSIISISRSSQRVVEALEEMKTKIPESEQAVTSNRPSLPKKDDDQLQALQSLATHMKLLLDAPEHIWRLLERKKFFQAAWLFLLARVVHRALVRTDTDDEDSWIQYGVNVQEQFPLVQRQWDTVAQFRSQITHKATLSLRENQSSSEDVCATLLTLHLLDSRPLAETLSTFLAQRTRALQTILAAYQTPVQSSSKQGNGHAPGAPKLKSDAASKPAKAVVRDVRQKMRTVLEAVSGTVTTARDVFQAQDNGKPSLISCVLGHIQSDPRSPSGVEILPTELFLTTQHLLSSLPSSTHFLSLPPNIKSYKPYVDLSSPSSTMNQAHLNHSLGKWFQKALEHYQTVMEAWMADLHTIREVWKVRIWLRKWLDGSSGLDRLENGQMKSACDAVCLKRITALWKASFGKAQEDFRERLATALATLKGSSESSHPVLTGVDRIYESPPIPGPSESSDLTAFLKYKSALQRQVADRTPLLDELVTGLETFGANMQGTRKGMKANDDDTLKLIQLLMEEYHPTVESFCNSLVDNLASACGEPADDSAFTLPQIMFVGRLADELSTSAPLVASLGCRTEASQNFRERTRKIHNGMIDRWKTWIVSDIVHRFHEDGSASFSPSEPSSALMQALFSLSTAILNLGMSHQPEARDRLAGECLRAFVLRLRESSQEHGWPSERVQSLWDLSFLSKLAALRGFADIAASFKTKKNQISKAIHTSHKSPVTDEEVSEYLSRSQLLLTPLLGPPLPCPPHLLDAKGKGRDKAEKSTPLLHHGVPTADQPFRLPMDVVKPSARFGLLLVGSTAQR